MNTNSQLIKSLLIGTQSKTRKKIFKKAGLNFKNYISPNIDETGLLKRNIIKESQQSLFLAMAKAKHIGLFNKNKIIVCFDTTIHLEGETIFKCKNREECVNILKKLNAKTHTLRTACVILKNNKTLWSLIDKCDITLKDNSNKIIKKYVDNYFNKIVNSVGCYNIEAEGSQLIRGFKGSFYSILGVPLIPFYRRIIKLK